MTQAKGTDTKAEWEALTEAKRREYVEMYGYGDLPYSDMRRFMPHAAAAYNDAEKEKEKP